MKKNPLEWAVFGVSLALIAGTAAMLVHAHVTSDDRPAAIVVTAGAPVTQSRGGYAVPLDVSNEGDTTAQAVVIEVTLSGRDVEERSQVELAFVPHGSRRRAWVMFTHDPQSLALRVRVVGYEEP
jgi:uncharacterized protein (TIGR02588 family)